MGAVTLPWPRVGIVDIEYIDCCDACVSACKRACEGDGGRSDVGANLENPGGLQVLYERRDRTAVARIDASQVVGKPTGFNKVRDVFPDLRVLGRKDPREVQ